jgi:hypothetical protein
MKLSLTHESNLKQIPVVESSRLGCSPAQENTDFHTLVFLHKLGRLTASDTRLKRGLIRQLSLNWGIE